MVGQLKQPVILSPLSESTNHRNDQNNHSNNHLSIEKLGNLKNGGILNQRLEIFFLSVFVFLEIEMVMINW